MQQKSLRTIAIHGGLFLLAWVTTMIAGAENTSAYSIWVDFSWEKFWTGLPYSFSFLLFLTCHEFGHYFTARYHQVKASLPYYIPLYIPIPGFFNIGSMGAIISLKSIPPSTRKYFDIGIAGPLAGFVISIGLLVYGFLNLPPLDEYVLSIHPEYLEIFGHMPSPLEMEAFAYLQGENGPVLSIGSNLLFDWMAQILPADPAQVPPGFELMHYPYLFVGYLTLFFTALNLLPIGQLDGGHIIYGMFGRKTAGIISRFAVMTLLIMGGTGMMRIEGWEFLSYQLGYLLLVWYIFRKTMTAGKPIPAMMMALVFVSAQAMLATQFPGWDVNVLWLLYSFMAVRMIKVDHPPALKEHRVNLPRQILGGFAILIFIVSFSPFPLKMIGMPNGELDHDFQMEIDRLQESMISTSLDTIYHEHIPSDSTSSEP
ncbi:site-2 protease family protein [Pontibacter sp. G13]|uniref:site-2 protease family protein n=1 Tax=Pontibacter sp. G13 TaxID=3074898 RepID=UPI002889B954|nr:site-2 protease family protein [Pontibacter sp. G13]WNJ21500.1 site-2 protease family protein [Pontibacter sp. G13]